MTDPVVPGMADAIERRRQAVGVGKGNLAKIAGVSRETLRPVLAGYRRAYNDETIFGLARALRWQNDWYQRLQAGDAPAELPPIDPEIEARLRAMEDRFSRIETALARLESGARPRELEER